MKLDKLAFNKTLRHIHNKKKKNIVRQNSLDEGILKNLHEFGYDVNPHSFYTREMIHRLDDVEIYVYSISPDDFKDQLLAAKEVEGLKKSKLFKSNNNLCLLWRYDHASKYYKWFIGVEYTYRVIAACNWTTVHKARHLLYDLRMAGMGTITMYEDKWGIVYEPKGRVGELEEFIINNIIDYANNHK